MRTVAPKSCLMAVMSGSINILLFPALSAKEFCTQEAGEHFVFLQAHRLEEGETNYGHEKLFQVRSDRQTA